MALIVPKIVYDPGTGAVTLAFTYPPISKPGADELEATRHDSTTSSGKRQSITERIDIFRTLQMDYVPFEDLAAWTSFLNYALTGGTFDYYADSTVVSLETFVLEDTDYAPSFNMRGISKFKLKLRKVSGTGS